MVDQYRRAVKIPAPDPFEPADPETKSPYAYSPVLRSIQTFPGNWLARHVAGIELDSVRAPVCAPAEMHNAFEFEHMPLRRADARRHGRAVWQPS